MSLQFTYKITERKNTFFKHVKRRDILLDATLKVDNMAGSVNRLSALLSQRLFIQSSSNLLIIIVGILSRLCLIISQVI